MTIEDEIPLSAKEIKRFREFQQDYDRWSFFGRTMWKWWMIVCGCISGAAITVAALESIWQNFRVQH